MIHGFRMCCGRWGGEEALFFLKARERASRPGKGPGLFFCAQTVDAVCKIDAIHQDGECLDKFHFSPASRYAPVISGKRLDHRGFLSPGSSRQRLPGRVGVEDVVGRVSFRQRRGDFGIEIRAYFEQETFRHLASTYRLHKEGSFRSGGEDSTLEERFSHHREVNGLTLPHSWTVRLSSRRANQASISEWQMEFTDWELNPEMPQNYFKIY